MKNLKVNAKYAKLKLKQQMFSFQTMQILGGKKGHILNRMQIFARLQSKLVLEPYICHIFSRHLNYTNSLNLRKTRAGKYSGFAETLQMENHSHVAK